ncbi:thermonuclease family protein [Ensifer aridi]|uniref:thermonuclease family protein n=1 Tax=Ensifer aridi TaxID=1708715 RepID=UPI00041FEDA9|nr:thermonuclease family protein [Ensifer aridi]
MRQQLITTAGGLAALALYAGILMSGADAIRNGESVATPDFVLETPEAAIIEEPPLQEEAPADTVGGGDSGADSEAASPAPAPDAEIGKSSRVAVRPIEPGLFTLPEDGVAKPLERVAPRPPLSKPPGEEKPATTVYRRPVALAAGLVRSDDKTLQIKDIEPQNAEKMCDGNGKSWPCGMVARTAFRNFLRARALVCDAPEESGGTVTARCSVGGQDIAAWLVANGWAMPLPGSALETKAEAARKARLGFHGDDPRDLSRVHLTVDDPSAGAVLDDAAPDL